MSALKRARLPSTRCLDSVGSEALYKRAKMEGALKAQPTIGNRPKGTVEDVVQGASTGNDEAQSAISQSEESDLEDSEDAWQETASEKDTQESEYGTPPPDSPSPKGKPSTPVKKKSPSKTPRKSPGTPRERAQVWTQQEDRVFFDILLETRMPLAIVEERLRAVQAKHGGVAKTRKDISNHYPTIRKRIEKLAGPAT